MRDPCSMKCLTVRQPWAWLIVNGHKDTENRTWRTHYRGPLLIHAAATADLDGWCGRDDQLGSATRLWAADRPSWWQRCLDACRDPHLLGAIVGVVTLTRCDPALTFGQPGVSPWAEYPEPLRRCGHPFWWWRIACAHTLREPVPMKGRLGLWDVTDQDVIDEAWHLTMGDEEWIHA